MYIVDMNVQGFTVFGFQAVSGMKKMELNPVSIKDKPFDLSFQG